MNFAFQQKKVFMAILSIQMTLIMHESYQSTLLPSLACLRLCFIKKVEYSLPV